MNKRRIVISLAVLAAAVGLLVFTFTPLPGTDTTEAPPWLPTAFDYPRRFAREMVYTVEAGQPTAVRVLLHNGGQAVTADWTAGGQVTYSGSADFTRDYSVSSTLLSVKELPSLVEIIHRWLQADQPDLAEDYTLILQPHDPDLPIDGDLCLRFSDGTVTPLTALPESSRIFGRVTLCDASHTPVHRIYLISGT